MSQSLATGGAEGQAVLSACELARRGQDVGIVTYYPGNDYADVIDSAGVKLVQVTQTGPLNLGRVRALVRHFRLVRPDVVHAFSATVSLYALLAGRLARVPAVFGGFRAQLPASRSVRWVNRFLSRSGAGWISNCNCGKDSIVEQFGVAPERVFVVPNGVPSNRIDSSLLRAEARKQFGLDDDGFVVTIVALLKPEKNHFMFLRMARRLIDSGQAATFVLAGDGAMREALQRRTEELSLTGHVRFLGRCGRVPDLLRATDVVVLTSLSEGLPNALLEGSGAGVPCVSTDNGGATDILVEGETGFIVPVDDDEAMTDRVGQLLADESLRARMGQAGRKRVLAMFSPGAVAERLVSVYRRALE